MCAGRVGDGAWAFAFFIFVWEVLGSLHVAHTYTHSTQRAERDGRTHTVTAGYGSGVGSEYDKSSVWRGLDNGRDARQYIRQSSVNSR
jgi:hypothetical protein